MARSNITSPVLWAPLPRSGPFFKMVTTMKITEAWEKKAELLTKAREKKACEEEYSAAINAATKNEYMDIVYRNFSWLVLVKIIDCWLPASLPNCQKLDCSNTQIASLPELPNCQILDCFNTQIESLPELPNCQILNCSSTRIASLPELPNCQILDCSNTQIESLPELPNCQALYCYNTKIASMPELPNFQILDCHNTPYFNANRHK